MIGLVSLRSDVRARHTGTHDAPVYATVLVKVPAILARVAQPQLDLIKCRVEAGHLYGQIETNISYSLDTLSPRQYSMFNDGLDGENIVSVNEESEKFVFVETGNVGNRPRFHNFIEVGISFNAAVINDINGDAIYFPRFNMLYTREGRKAFSTNMWPQISQHYCCYSTFCSKASHVSYGGLSLRESLPFALFVLTFHTMIPIPIPATAIVWKK